MESTKKRPIRSDLSNKLYDDIFKAILEVRIQILQLDVHGNLEDIALHGYWRKPMGNMSDGELIDELDSLVEQGFDHLSNLLYEATIDAEIEEILSK